MPLAKSAWVNALREHIFRLTALKSLASSRLFPGALPGIGALLLGACAAVPPPMPPAEPRGPAASPAAAAGAGAGLQDAGWGVLRSSALGLKLALPQARSWSSPAAAPAESATWRLVHAPSSTSLEVRRWRASRLPRVEACDAELRQRVPGLFAADETNLVAERQVRIPQGFVTRITLLAEPQTLAAGVRPLFSGQALAVGAGIGECLAVVARTETRDEAELAERLRLLDVALGHLRLSHVEDRVPPPPPLPR